MPFAQIYECPNCGDVWQGVEIIETDDHEHGEVYEEARCACGASVTSKIRDGKRVVHLLTQ